MEYGEQKKAAFESLKAGKAIEDLGERLKFLYNADDKAGEFLFQDHFGNAGFIRPTAFRKSRTTSSTWTTGHEVGICLGNGPL